MNIPIGTSEGKSRTLKAQYYKDNIINFCRKGFNSSGVAERITDETIMCKFKERTGGQQDAQPSVQDRIYDVNGKGTAVTQSFLPNVAIQVGCMPNESGELTRAQAMRIYDGNCKSVSLKAEGGGMGAKTGLYAMNEKPIYQVKDRKITIKGKEYPIQLEDGYYNIRKLTVEECMRLQTVPEWYEFPVSNSQAYKMLGNGWTCDVITHLINCCLNGELAPEQMTLF